MPEKIAIPPGRRAPTIAGSSVVLTVRRMLESSRSAGPGQGGELAGVAVEELHLRRHAVPLGVALGHGVRLGVVLDADRAGGAQLDRGDGEDPAAASEVEHPVAGTRSVARASGARRGWSRARRCRTRSRDRGRPYGSSGSRASASQDGTTVSRPNCAGPALAPARRPVHRSSQRAARRAVFRRWPSSAIERVGRRSSAAKVTSVPSSRSSTACPVRATSHAPTAVAPLGRGPHVDRPPAHAPSASLSLDQKPGDRFGGSPFELGQLAGRAAPARR